MTVRELLARIDSRELTEWMAFYSLEPWGSQIDDDRAGVIAATVANVHRDPKKRSRPYEATDMIPPRHPDEAEEMTMEQDGARWASFFSPFTRR